MATQTLTTLDAILKNVYRGVIVEQLNQETYLIDQIEKTNANDLGAFNGRQLVFAVHTARNRGRGAVTDGGTLPGAGGQSYLDGIVTMKQRSEAVELTQAVIDQTQKDEGAFVKALTSEMDGAITDLRKDVCREAYGTGDGLLATITGTPNGTSITVDSGQYISVGDTVDIVVKSSGATTNGVLATQVTAVSFGGTKNSSTQANATLTISPGSAGALANTYGVYISGNRSNESDGLRNIISTGRTLHQINSSTYPIWDANVLDAGNSNPNEDTLIQLSQQTRQRSGKTPDLFLGTLGGQRRLAAQYSSQKRWNDANVTKIDGGYSAIMVAAGNDPIPFVADVDAVNGVVFALRKDSFAWAEGHAAGWLTPPDGGPVLQLKDGSTSGTKQAIWQGFVYWASTLVNVAPNRNGKLINVNDDLPVLRV